VDGKVEPEKIVGSEEEREIEERLDVHARNIRRNARRTKALEEQAGALKLTVETLSQALRVTQEELAGVKTQYTQNIERLSAELAETAQQLKFLQTRVG
jgi:chromosome segregation ATPase